MSFNTHNIYHPLIVKSGWTSQSVSATTISAGTFYGGSLSATYVGNQNVTNQEFSYVSGLTSNTQTQLNNLVNRTERLLTIQSNEFLTNDRVISSGSNINFEYTNSHLGISASFPSVEVGTIGTTLTSSQTAITNFNPTGWNDSVTKATHIIITGNSYSIISGLVGGTNGRIAIISNFGTGLIILEHESSATTVGNQFKFDTDFPYFLHSDRSITLIYNSQNGWTNYFKINENGFKKFEDFTGTVMEQYIAPGTLGNYFRSTKFTGNNRYNAGIQYTGSTNSFGVGTVFTVTSPTATWARSAQFGAQRRLLGSTLTCSVAKIKLSQSFGFFNSSNSCSFSTYADLRNNYSTDTSGAGNYPAWITPITSITNSNITNWYIKSSTTYTPTDIPLSYSVDNWVYFGIFVNEILEANTINAIAFFYSYDNKNYKWQTIEPLKTLNGSNHICVNCATNSNSFLPFMLIDWMANV
jgi:hypothetical protein